MQVACSGAISGSCVVVSDALGASQLTRFGKAVVLAIWPTGGQVADGAPIYHHDAPRCFQDGSLFVSSISLTAVDSGSLLIGCHDVSVVCLRWSTGDHALSWSAV